MPFLHDHKRRVPPQNVYRCIVIGIHVVPAMATDKSRLVLTTFSVYGPAFRADLRCVVSRYLAKVSAPFFQFVAKQGFEDMPTLIQDRPVQPRLLAHHTPRIGKSAFGNGSHTLDVELFKHHGARAFAKIPRNPIVPVLADAPLTGLYGRNTASLFGVSDGPAFSASKHTLSLSLFAVKHGKAGRKGQHLARGQCQCFRHPAVNTDLRRQGCGRRIMLNREVESDMPTARSEIDRDVVQCASQRPSVAVSHPADLGQTDLGPLGIQLAILDFTALKAERVVDATPSESGVFCDTIEEVGVGSVKVAQGLLLRSNMDSANPVVFFAQHGQFTGLGRVVDGVPCTGLELPPEIAALLKCNVVNKAADASKLHEQGYLFVTRMQFVLIAASFHAVYIAIGPSERKMEYRTGRHVVYMLHVHLVFVPRCRRDVLSDLAIRDLQRIFAKVCTDFEAELIECDGEDDHVHLLVHYPPKLALSKLVNSIKNLSSRLLRETRPEVTGRYHKGVLWPPSYFAASCGGAPLSVIAEYVKSQSGAARSRSRIPPRPEGRGFQREKG